MPSLIDLKKRITSTRSTQKITSAMKMVSVAKLKKATKDIENISNYSRSILHILSQINKSYSVNELDLSHENKHIRTNVSIFKKSFDAIYNNGLEGAKLPKLFIVISPDKGLCGSLNTNIINTLNREIALVKSRGDDFVIMPIGKKIVDYCSAKYSKHIIANFDKYDLKHLAQPQLEKISQTIIDLLDESLISSSFVIYSRFTSVIKQEIVCKALVPFVIAHDVDEVAQSYGDHTSEIKHKINFLFEPSIERVISDLVVERISAAILTFVKNTEASEHASRMLAMDNATTNSAKVIKKLKLKYDRTRQSSITSQILEIVGGMEAVL